MFLLQIGRVFFTFNGLMFCEMNAKELQGCNVFSHYSQQRLSFSESFLCDAIYGLSLLAVCLSYSLLSFPQKCILGLSFLGEPFSCPCFKSQREKISKAETWGRCVTTPCLHECRSVLPYPAISSSQRCLTHLDMHKSLHIIFFLLFFF